MEDVHVLGKITNGQHHSMMCKNFVSMSISKKRISHCLATTPDRKQYFFENLFTTEFRLGTVEHRKGYSAKCENLHR